MSLSFSGVEFYEKGNNINMFVLQGKTLRFSYILGGDTPVDVTGYGAVFQARDENDALIVEASTANGMIVTGGVNGKFDIDIPASTSRDIETNGIYEMELTAPDGSVYLAMSGDFSHQKRKIQ